MVRMRNVATALLAGGTAIGLAVATPAAGVNPATPVAMTGSDPASVAFDAAVANAKAAMMADPASAMKPVLQAGHLAKNLSNPVAAQTALATVDWLHGEALSRVYRQKDALPFLEAALKRARAVAPRTKLEADITLARGTAETSLGNVRASLADFQDAYGLYVRLADARGQAKALLSMGGIYSDAGDNSQSLRYYSQVPDVYRGDPAIDLAAHNNMGETLKKLGRFRDAETEYRKALEAASALDSPVLQVRILTNLASAQLQDGAVVSAKSSADRALLIAGRADPTERPFAWGVKAQIAEKEGDYAAASADLQNTFAGTDLATTTATYRDFHETAYRVYQHLGLYPLALEHLEAFKRLDDEAQKLTASSSAALVTARFDFANQDLRIARLKAEKVRQQAMMEQSKARLHTILFSTILAAAAAVLALLLAGFVSLSRSRNRERAANARLSEANVSLQAALKVKTEFLAMTSHEIRTPLNGILGMAQVILADREVPDTLKDKIEVVQSAGETMRALVDDILDVAKIESGNLTITRNPMDLRALIDGAQRLWRAEAESKGLTIALDIDGAPTLIEEDEGRLRQIIFNLMSNAVKFTERGGVVLSGRADTAEVGEVLRIEVADTGIGIASDQLDIIFESFRQVDGGTSRKYGGTGLGLAICRDLARAMGGDVTVDSEPGIGSRFRLWLPLTRIAQPDDERLVRTCEPVASLSAANLLLLDANPLSQRIIVNSLAAHCAKVSAAADPAHALEHVQTGQVHHLLIEACALPSCETEAFVTLGRLAAATHAVGGRVSVLFAPTSGYSGERLRVSGADHVIAKPVSAAQLAAALAASYAPAQGDEMAA